MGNHDRAESVRTLVLLPFLLLVLFFFFGFEVLLQVLGPGRFVVV